MKTIVQSWIAYGVGFSSLVLGCEQAEVPRSNVRLAASGGGASAPRMVSTPPSDGSSTMPTGIETAKLRSNEAGDIKQGLPSSDCRHPAPTTKCSAGFCRVEPGCFVMGAPRTEFGIGRFSDRQAQVTLTRPFLIGQTEVTRQQWQSVVLPIPKQFEPALGPARCIKPDCPIANVNFFDAAAFANRYSEKRGLPSCYELKDCSGDVGDGYMCKSVTSTSLPLYDCGGYRLPTEAEWEYAARGGTTTAFFSGDVTRQPDGGCYPDPNLDPAGWYCHNSGGKAHPVSGKARNAWGLFDTSGNLSEWCNDLITFGGYGDGPFVDPIWPIRTGRELSVTPEHPYRISRGGNYLSPACDSKTSWRAAFPDDTLGANVGFRLARTIKLPAGR
jgi:sulfatase modifying factor 1